MNKHVPNGSIFSATIDYEARGKHFGHIQIPHSRDDAGLGSLLVPVISIRNGEGPCLLLTAGNHGDEFEGQIALRNLAHELSADEVSGQIIIVPALNLPAVLNNSRCSPIDGKNMNRIFPGDRRGTITEKIASYVYDELVQRADAVVDLHAGGTNLSCLCYAMMHRYPNLDRSRETLALMKAFAVPFGVVFDTEPDRDGMLDTAVEDLDKPFIAVELGGSGSVTPQSVAITKRGVRNVLIHRGLMKGNIEPGDQPMEVVGVPPGGFVSAEDHGIFEPFFDLGDMVESGQAVGQMHSIHRPDRQPIVHHIEDGGRVLTRRTTGLTTHGDCVLAVGVPLDPGF
jgi:N-alpha-acetyl-L-2,4-diaminobutyrate deacetylase